VVDVGDDDLADLGLELAEDAVSPHLCHLVLIVLRGRDEVHRVRLEAVHQEEVDERHQALLAHRLRKGVLVAHREDVAVTPVVDGSEDYVGELLLALVVDSQLEQLGAGSVWPHLDAEPAGEIIMMRPHRQPLLEELLRHLGLYQVLVLGRALAHRHGRRSAPRRRDPGAREERSSPNKQLNSASAYCNLLFDCKLPDLPFRTSFKLREQQPSLTKL
jgi:hypothetical protein